MTTMRRQPLVAYGQPLCEAVVDCPAQRFDESELVQVAHGFAGGSDSREHDSFGVPHGSGVAADHEIVSQGLQRGTHTGQVSGAIVDYDDHGLGSRRGSGAVIPTR